MLPYPDQFCVVADALRRRALGPPGIARPRRGHPAALGQPARCYLRQRTPHHGVSIRRRRLRHGGRHLRAQFPIRLRPDPIPRRHPAQLARIVGVPAPAGDPCAICRDEFAVGSDAAGMPCGHAFHEGCLRRHLEARADCPMCRVAL
ncbi:hypothetical protein DFJ74DRAFT_773838 [Hyaloraphidium curvatum]|nr:hypothetical protein DFJ74DRAFT_773838 [Hyaloraphidium curvatum]